MISLDPLHYVAAGLTLALVVSVGYGMKESTQRKLIEAKYHTFVAETKAAASQQIALNAQETVKRDTITKNLEDQNAKLQSDVAKRYADARRLHNSSASSGGVSTIPTIPEGRACEQRETEPVAAIHGFEGRILDILEQGDKAIAESITLEDWMDQQKVLSK